MPSGIQLINTLGQVDLEITDRLTRLVGVYETSKSSGGVTLGADVLGSGTPAFVVVPLDDDPTLATPAVSFSSDAVSWSYGFPSGFCANARVFVFIY